MTDHVFAFNGRMLAILCVVLLLLLATSFGLGMLYADYRSAGLAPHKPLAAAVK